jgi:hypothetical protein
MKITVSLNEMKSSFELIKRLGITATQLETIIAMKDDEEIKVSEFIAKYDVDAEKYFGRETFEATKFSSLKKYSDDNGVVLYDFVISEQFVCEADALIGDFLETLIAPLKMMIKGIMGFVNVQVKAFASKWNLSNTKINQNKEDK